MYDSFWGTKCENRKYPLKYGKIFQNNVIFPYGQDKKEHSGEINGAYYFPFQIIFSAILRILWK